MPVTDLHDAHVAALEERATALRRHAARCEAELGERRPAVAVGVARDLIETRSRLAQVRRDLRRLGSGRG